MRKNIALLISLPIFLLVTLTGCLSLAEDVTPPPGFGAPSLQGVGQLNPTKQVEEIPLPTEPAIVADSSPKERTITASHENIDVNVINYSDGELPTNMEVVLRGYDEMSEIYTETAILTKGNTVQFTEVPMEIGRMYFATIEHGNAAYGSNVININEDVTSLSLDIAYYQSTSNPAILDVDRIHIFIDFIDQETLEIFQLYIFSNPTNQVLVPKVTGETVVEFNIPANADNVHIEEYMQLAYRKTESGFGISSIYPDVNPYQAAFSYQLPYEGKKLDLNIPITMDASAIIVLAPANGFKVKSNQLEEAGTREFEGASYNMFTGVGILSGNSLQLYLSGFPKVKTNFLTLNANQSTNLVIGLGGFGVALITVGLFLRRRNKAFDVESNDDFDGIIGNESPDDRIDAIIALDDQFRTGSFPEEAYHKRRALLKERLRVAIEKND